MSKYQNEYQEKLSRHYEGLKNKMDATIEAASDLPQIPDDVDTVPYYDVCSPGMLRVDIPYDLLILKDLRNQMGDKWVVAGVSKTGEGMAKYYTHRETGVELLLNLRTSLDGSTCRAVQVGVKEVPVFEIQCS